MSRTVESVPRWAVVTTFVLSIIGLGFSIYLTITHFQPHALVCADTGTINCAKVTTSAQSYFLGIPVAVLGLFNFVVMVALTSPWAWRAKKYWLHVARFAFTVAGMGFVLWLIYAEIMLIGNICLYCTGVHIVTFAQLIVLTRVTPTQLGWVDSAPLE